MLQTLVMCSKKRHEIDDFLRSDEMIVLLEAFANGMPVPWEMCLWIAENRKVWTFVEHSDCAVQVIDLKYTLCCRTFR